MKNYEALELAEKAGLIKSNWSPIDGAFASTQFDIQDELYVFVWLIEQATLERAAKVANGVLDHATKMHDDAYSNAKDVWRAYMDCAKSISTRIDQLKDSNE